MSMPSGKQPESGKFARAISAEIRSAMARQRMSGAQLASKTDRSQSYISKRLRDEVAFTANDVEEICVSIHVLTKRERRGKERMWRDNEPARLPRLQRRQVREGVDILCGSSEVQKQNMATFDCPLDPGYERDPASGRVVDERTQIELPLVKCDC